MMTCAPLTGTPSGYQRHKRASEKPCGACRDARNAYRRHWRATRKPGQPRPVPPGLPRGLGARARPGAFLIPRKLRLAGAPSGC